MRSRARYVLIVVAGLSLSACRQADGPIPTPNKIIQEELLDVVNDLQNVGSGRDPQAPKDLADDLRKYARKPSAEPSVDELSLRVTKALAGTNLDEQARQRLTHMLWLSAEARELSERQVEVLQNDVQSLLMSVGVAQENAERVAAQVGDVQVAVNEHPRRWYELF